MSKQEVVKELSNIKGIGKAKAESIYDNGFDSIDKIKKASIKDLTKVNGITESIAKNIQKELVKETKKEKPKQEKKTKSPDKKELKKTQTKKEKPKPSKKEKAAPKKEEKEEEEDKEETTEYIVKKKAKLTDEQIKKLRLRKQIKKRTPEFLREEWFRYKKIPKNWRRPDGITSKMRINLKYRPSKVRVGFRGPKDTRGLHPSGFEEVTVYNVNDLEKIDPKTQAARIGGTVGTKKRMDIEKKAEELEVRILNL